MADKTIPELEPGGAAQAGDLVPGFRSGATPSEDVSIELGTMASEDKDDYPTTAEQAAAINLAPTVVLVTGNLTLDEDTHNGAEIYLLANTSSPSHYTVTIPQEVSVGFRCTFFNIAAAGEVTIQAETGSPNDELNGIESGAAVFGIQNSGAYLRKYATRKLMIVGGGVIVS